jgi:hypothetical protein
MGIKEEESMSSSVTRRSRREVVKAIGAGSAWVAAVMGFFGVAAATKKEEQEEPDITALGGTEGLNSELDPLEVDHPALAAQLGSRSLPGQEEVTR